jgi:hypothetical protein
MVVVVVVAVVHSMGWYRLLEVVLGVVVACGGSRIRVFVVVVVRSISCSGNGHSDCSESPYCIIVRYSNLT